MIKQESAETIGLQALGWLAGNDEVFPVFLGASGARLEDLARGARDPAFLAAVLDFLLQEDAWVLDCTAALGLPGDALARARMALPGGGETSWT